MLDARKWVGELASKICQTFGARALFVGFQGSYRRGEATDSSDIDVVVILDCLDLEDLKTYKKLIESMPHAEKACGFICGKDELLGWPKHEIFQMTRDTEAIIGTLDGIVPETTRSDIVDSLRITAGGAYHALCHTYVYGNDGEKKCALISSVYKSAFFALQLLYFLRTGDYIETKDALRAVLSGRELEIMRKSMNAKDTNFLADAEGHFGNLIEWAGSLLRDLNETQ